MNEIKQVYFRMDLDDPAVPSFCSFPKSYFGTLANIDEAVSSMEQKGVCSDTVDAYKRYLAGELDVEHCVCYNKTKLLNPVEMISVEKFELDDVQWNHTNTWDCIYTMRALHISVKQAVFFDGEYYYRCIMPEFSDLQYNGIRPGHWIDVGQQLWGNVGVIRAGKYKCTFNLFVEEECSMDLNAIMANMGAEDKLDFSRACDEIFGNG